MDGFWVPFVDLSLFISQMEIQEINQLWKAALSVCSDALIQRFYLQFQQQVKDGFKGIV